MEGDDANEVPLPEDLAAEWEPSMYTDEYRGNLMTIIQGNVKGRQVHLDSPTEPRDAKVVDLMERLRRSLAQGGRKKAAFVPKRPSSHREESWRQEASRGPSPSPTALTSETRPNPTRFVRLRDRWKIQTPRSS